MKRKILLILILGVVITYVIYNLNFQNKIYFVSLGDGLATGMTAYNIEGYNYNDYIKEELEKKEKLEEYIYAFSKSNQSIENLITCIENNYKLEENNLTIQQSLAKSKIVTVAIGIDELANMSLKQPLPTKEKDDYKKDMNKLIKLIRNFTTGKIFVLGIYQAYNLKEDDVIEINQSIKEISQKNQAIFIDISELSNNKDYFLLDNSYYFNYKAHQEISKKIIGYLDL